MTRTTILKHLLEIKRNTMYWQQTRLYSYVLAGIQISRSWHLWYLLAKITGIDFYEYIIKLFMDLPNLLLPSNVTMCWKSICRDQKISKRHMGTNKEIAGYSRKNRIVYGYSWCAPKGDLFFYILGLYNIFVLWVKITDSSF